MSDSEHTARFRTDRLVSMGILMCAGLAKKKPDNLCREGRLKRQGGIVFKCAHFFLKDSSASKTSRAVTFPSVIRSIVSAHFVGITFQCWTAWYVTPSSRERALFDPKWLIVRFNVLSMPETLPEFLASCKHFLYRGDTSKSCILPQYG